MERMRSGPFRIAKLSNQTARAMAQDMAAGAFAQATMALIARHGITACARGVRNLAMSEALFALGVGAALPATPPVRTTTGTMAQ
ncbi:hypothetical protein RDV64_12275 [Acuticoccus sp. MNP-M23]|uniref:hypothetical protein n=1 Tax=Acuticoccus sp. MNP-M23 TaxID=3072793 RepID=UPI002815540C|nr:hypothetical protein [Acuticoccus sp. MNP-M23]WMS40872.1 hypothetical protein RDV64_12275 [Acuticoccus sp. MNP-M23]